MSDTLRAITGHIEAALEHVQSAVELERGMGLESGTLAKVLLQAKRTTSRVLDELDVFERFPRVDAGLTEQ